MNTNGSNEPVTISRLHLTFRNLHGSVQHYYHFLFAFLIPLVRVWNSIALTPEVVDVYVRSCAIMDQLLLQLRLPGLVIVDAADHAAMSEQQTSLAATGNYLFLTVEGYDDTERYDAKIFESVRDQLFFRFSEEIRKEMLEINKSFTGNGLRIAIINRLPPNKFYSEAECEIKTAGSERRSIANMDELCSAVSRHSDNVFVAALEGRNLYYQMALFSAADIVICQHGAALGNLVWARKATHVIDHPKGPGGTYQGL